MTKTSTTYSYRRLDHSEYHKKAFLKAEEKALYDIKGMAANSKNLILITNTKTQLDKISDETLNQTKLMIHPNSGYDNFQASFVKSVNFPIIVGNPIRAHAVINYILSGLFHFYAAIPSENKWDPARKFKRKLLIHSKVLIVGHGHIGKILSKSLRPLVDALTIYDPFYNEEDHVHPEKNISKLPLEQYDCIIMAASLNETSYGLIDATVLSQLSPHVLIINAARGQLINQNDLIPFLLKNQDAYAYLDVFSQEPLIDVKNFWPKNCLKTSHIAGVFTQLDEEIIQFEKKVIKYFIDAPNCLPNIYPDLCLSNRLSRNILI